MRLVNLTLGLLLAVGVVAAAPSLSVAFADEEAAPAAEKATFDESLCDIPDGESAEFYLKRIQDLQNSFVAFRKGATTDELKAVQPKFNGAQEALVKKLAFAEDAAPDVSFGFFRSYTLMAAHSGNVEELDALLKAEKEKEKADQNRVGWLNYLVQCLSVDKAGEKGADELKKAIEGLEKAIMEDDFVAQRVEEYASIIAQYDEAASKAFLEKALESFKAAKDGDIRKALAKNIEGKKRFMELVGKEMIVEGVYDDGTEIDWKSYRGKVVLVDFWATWCGPCVAEVPNVLKLYEKYHDAGFDVLGYSLDSDLEALEKFEKERKLPWRTGVRKLSMKANEEDGKNYTNLCEYYGITAIPTMILVDKDGKVISTEARGARLQKLLEEAFPDVK